MRSQNTSLAQWTDRSLTVAPGPVSPDQLSDQARVLYRWLADHGPSTLSNLAESGLTSTDGALSELATLGLIRRNGQTVQARPLAEVLYEVMRAQARRLDRAVRGLTEGQRLMHILINEHPALSGDSAEVVRSVQSSSPDAQEDWTQYSSLQAEQRLATLNPASTYPDEVLEASLTRAAEDLERGVTLQALHQRSVLGHVGFAQYLWRLEQLGVQVRLRDHIPFRMMIFDDRVAGCSLSASPTATETILLHGPRLVSLLGHIFQTLWLEAEPLPDPGVVRRPATAESLTPQHLTILRCLADGATDQTVARALGITPRTVTRRLNEIYDALGVRSRFQAGLTARRMGLV
jgi:DNA-binding CsgD family transcriptional regulator